MSKEKLSASTIVRLLAKGLSLDEICQIYPPVTKEDVKSILEKAALTIEQINSEDKLESKQKLIIYIDGASRGNPGQAGIGVIIYNSQNKILKEIKKHIGVRTNNLAEYQALLEALKAAANLKAEMLIIRSDSELLIKQMQGLYKVKDEKLKNLFRQAQMLVKNFKNIKFEHIIRQENKLADSLANQAINLASTGNH